MLPSDSFYKGIGNAALIENLLTVLIYIHLISHSGKSGNELAGGLSDIKGTWYKLFVAYTPWNTKDMAEYAYFWNFRVLILSSSIFII